MSEQFKAAIVRAAWQCFLVGAATFLTTWSQTNDIKTLVIATLTPMIGYLATRVGVEGYYDTQRNRAGTVHPGDVTAAGAGAGAAPGASLLGAH